MRDEDENRAWYAYGELLGWTGFFLGVGVGGTIVMLLCRWGHASTL